MFILNLILFILVLGVIILIHELGHFFFAKRAKILCHEFSIGMGPAIYQKRKGETIYSIRGIPIGGYVSMAGESINDALIKKGMVVGIHLNSNGVIDEIILHENATPTQIGSVIDFDLYGKNMGDLFLTMDIQGDIQTYPVLRDAKYVISEKRSMWITPAEKSFESKSLWQRFLVIFAGPLMNFILALLLFLIVGFFMMKPNVESNEVSSVATFSPAHAIGIEAGDQIIAINNIPVNSWTDLSGIMRNLDSPNVKVTYARAGASFSKDTTTTVIIQMAGISNVYTQGLYYSADPILGQVFGRASSEAGLRIGDVIVSYIAGGKTYPIQNWDDILSFFQTHRSGEITVNYLRDGRVETATYDLISEYALQKLGHEPIVMQLGITGTASFNLGYSLTYPFLMVGQTTSQVLNTLGLLFMPSEKIGVKDLSGPIGIFSLVSQTAQQGFIAILSFTAFLSINIGLLNLLPIPALDGGRLVFLGVEAITRKPLPRKIENSINNAMFILLMVLFLFVTYNDILRLFQR